VIDVVIVGNVVFLTVGNCVFVGEFVGAKDGIFVVVGRMDAERVGNFVFVGENVGIID